MGKQLSLPFEEPVLPGWTGKQYMFCNDGLWHLVLSVREEMVADTQCCEDVRLLDTNEKDAPICPTCAQLQFGRK